MKTLLIILAAVFSANSAYAHVEDSDPLIHSGANNIISVDVNDVNVKPGNQRWIILCEPTISLNETKFSLEVAVQVDHSSIDRILSFRHFLFTTFGVGFGYGYSLGGRVNLRAPIDLEVQFSAEPLLRKQDYEKVLMTVGTAKDLIAKCNSESPNLKISLKMASPTVIAD